MRWLRASLILQILLTLYFQAIMWFPLGAWNDQPGKRLLQSAAEGHVIAAIVFSALFWIPILIYAIAFWKRIFWLMWLGLIGYCVWAFLQVQSWWIPWIFGADARARANQVALARTYKFFPQSLEHPAPDAMHFTLDLLLFAVCVTLLIGLRHGRSQIQSEISAN
jgi:magnesium-transporting ATPase (P-type)